MGEERSEIECMNFHGKIEKQEKVKAKMVDSLDVGNVLNVNMVGGV